MGRPPKVLYTFHPTAAVRSYEATIDWFARFTGCTIMEFSNAAPPVARSGGCNWLVDNQIELAEPNAPDTPTQKFLDRFGPGYLNLALMVDDLAVADEWFTAHGAKPTLPPATRFTFTRPAETCGLQFEWADFDDLSWDPRHNGRYPAKGTPLIDVARTAAWGALVADPRKAVARLRELTPMPIAFERYGAPAGEPAAGLSVGDCVLALYKVPATPEDEARLWGTRVARPRFHLMTFRVRDLAAARAAFTREKVRILREDAANGLFITHPEDTQGLCMAWTDRDYPGDPRGPL